MSSTKVKPARPLKFIFIPSVSFVLRQLSRSRYVLSIVLFFTGLYFFLHNKVLFTPDFGSSDAYHLNFSGKYYLAQALKNNLLPHWTWLFSGGYPVLAESQIGALHLINIILLKLLPFNIAYNLLYLVPLTLFSIGMYAVLREYKVRPLSSLLLSLNATFSGVLMFQLTHLNLIQAASYFPILYYVVLRFITSYRKRYLVLIPLIISQMIFAGHTQTAFIVLFTLSILTLLNIKELSLTVRQKWYLLFQLGLSSIVGLFISLPQILPSLLLTQYAVRATMLDYSTATQFPFLPKNTLNFITPFIFGNPKEGTYPVFSQHWGIFWENTPYVGEIFIFFILFLISILFLTKINIFKNKLVLPLVLFTGFLLLLILGKNSPLYFIFNFPPFNFYRVPSRFLLAVLFILFLACGIALQKIEEKILKLRPLLAGVLFLNLILLIWVTAQYHLFIPYDQAIKKPAILAVIKNKGYYSALSEQVWNEYFTKNGWKTETEKKAYQFLRNSLYANSNLLFDLPTLHPNTAGLQFRRNSIFESMLLEDIRFQDKTLEKVASNTAQMFSYLGTEFFISPYKIAAGEKPLAVYTYKKTALYVYPNTSTNRKEVVYVPSQLKQIELLTELSDSYKQNINFYQTALVEEKIPGVKNIQRGARVENVRITNTEIKLKTTTRSPTFVVAKINYYPEWKIFIDGKESKAYRANFIHTGFITPAGTHAIELRFNNGEFYKGVYLALAVAGIYAVFLVQLIRLQIFERFGLRAT